ncbi:MULTISPECIES: ferredoxin [unclassified Streptomyces]|uniref:ferredoxin n=1 Tax=unclassified Streptomyces TaxID=2593676 RepID=UPI002E24A27E|nr:ferredoxin [Streptomyces sp. NBC_01023]
MAVRPDNRLLDAPMVPVACGTCGAWVEARKSSWEQTSVQWNTEALAACSERRAAGPGAAFTGCPALRATIRQVAAEGGFRAPSGYPDHPGTFAEWP